MGPDPEHPYLGTHLTPREYYRRHAKAYANPHADGIAEVLTRLMPHITGQVLDLGCGDGLVTKLLAGVAEAHGITGFVGVDDAPKMVERYRKETGQPGVVARFVDALPTADTVVASYALHLATPADVPLMWWRLWETGARAIVVITPFKQRPPDPTVYFTVAETLAGPYGPDRKTIYGRVFTRQDG